MNSLILIILSLLMAASGIVWSPDDSVPMIPGYVIHRDDGYTFITRDRECSSGARAGCAYYALVALQDHYPGLTWAQLAAIVAQTEFGVVWSDDLRGVISTLIWRSLFDSQSGACRYAHRLYDCSLDNVLAWMADQQGLIDAVVVTKDHVRVNVARLTGIRDCAAEYCRGYQRYMDYLSASVIDHLDIWRTGLGPNVPSVSGLFCLPTGATLRGEFFARVPVGPCDGGTLIWMIVGTDNRHDVVGN